MGYDGEIVFFEGFDGFEKGGIEPEFAFPTREGLGMSPSSVTRNGGRSIGLGSSGVGIVPFDGGTDKVVVGLACRADRGGSHGQRFASVNDENGAQVYALGQYEDDLAILDENEDPLARSEGIVFDGPWYFAELVVDAAEGKAQLWVDGVLEAELTGETIPTIHSARCISGDYSSSSTFRRGWLDDFYVKTGVDRLGNCRVDLIDVVGDGDHSEWEPEGAIDNWEAVKLGDGSGDWTDDWVKATNSGERDRYKLEDSPVPSNYEVLGLKLDIGFKLQDGGVAGQLIPSLHVGSTDDEADPRNLPADWQIATPIYTDNPDTAQPWDPADLVDVQVGIRAEFD